MTLETELFPMCINTARENTYTLTYRENKRQIERDVGEEVERLHLYIFRKNSIKTTRGCNGKINEMLQVLLMMFHIQKENNSQNCLIS